MPSGLGAFAAGLASGGVTGFQISQAMKKDKRDQEAHEAKMAEQGVKLGRMKKEETLFDKDLQLRGAQADYNMNEQALKSEMQPVLQEAERTRAQAAPIKASGELAQAQADAALQPDALRARAMEVRGKVAEMIPRQGAILWGLFKNGYDQQAIDLYNKSGLIHPGQEASGARIDQVEAKDATGKVTTVPTLRLIGQDGQPVFESPVSQMENLYQSHGAKYEKFGNTLVRIGPDGKSTPIYEGDQYMAVPEGATAVSKRTGMPAPATGGVMSGATLPNGARIPPKPEREAGKYYTGEEEAAITKVLQPRFGGKFEGGLFFPDEQNKDVAARATALVPHLVRQRGMGGVEAGNEAAKIAEKGTVGYATVEDAQGKRQRIPAISFNGEMYPLSQLGASVDQQARTARAPTATSGVTPAGASAPVRPSASSATTAASAPTANPAALGLPQLVTARAQEQSPKARAAATREQKRAELRSAQADAEKTRTADTFRSILRIGNFKPEDQPIIEAAIDSGKLSEQERQTAQTMLGQIKATAKR